MLKEYYEKKFQELEEEKQRLNSQIIPYKKFSLFDRIFRRKSMKEQIENLDRTNYDINKRIYDIEDEIRQLERDKGSLSKELIEDVIEYAKSGKISFEFGKEDEKIGEYMAKNYAKNGLYFDEKIKEEAYKSLEDFLLVHKTDFFPKNDTIYTAKSTNAKRKNSFEFRGKEYEVDTPVLNNSTHFAINGPVSSHEFGDWDSKKYAVVVNFNEVHREKLLAIRLEDTYFEGDVHFEKEYYLLVPKSETEESEKRNINLNVNPNAIIVPYDGLELNDATLGLIACLGKKPELITNNGWIEDNNIIERAYSVLEPYMKGEKYTGGTHIDSENIIQKAMEERAEIMISIYEFLVNKGLDPTLEEITEIEKNLVHISNQHREEDKELIFKYYIKTLERKGYAVSEELLQDKRLAVKPINREGYFKGKNYTNLDVFDEYFCKALFGGKEKEEKQIESDNSMTK